MRKGNLVRIRPKVANADPDFDLRASRYDMKYEFKDAKALRRYTFCGAWPLTTEERRELRDTNPDKEPPLLKHVPLEANMYLLEAARVVARDLAYNGYGYWGMAIIRDLVTGQQAYVEREALEPVNTSKKYKLRHCVVKDMWLLEKA
ncbi:MAG: hypothetical protein VXX11_03540 [Planctomycetota bacterium]|nr:hypothetical protein [Planctomycetota bacterium]